MTTFRNRGVRLESVEDLVKFSAAVFNSGIVPDQYKNKESVIVAIQAGAELGIPPIASLQSFVVTRGKLSIWGDSMLGVCMASPDFDHDAFKEYIEKDKAVCIMGRKGHAPITRTFSKDDAKKAGLLGKAGIWQQYTDRMLQMRARAYACRDLFPDILRGVGATEVQDEEEVARMEAESEPVKEKPALAAAVADKPKPTQSHAAHPTGEPVNDDPMKGSIANPDPPQSNGKLAKDGEVLFGDPEPEQEPDPVDALSDDEVIAKLIEFCATAAAIDKIKSGEACAKYLRGEIDGHTYVPGSGPEWFNQGDTEERCARRMAAARGHLSFILAMGAEKYMESFK